MKMQDKEFDDIFRSQLDGFEAEPSDRVWTGIDDELDADRRRKLWIPILRVAAIFLLVGSVGVAFVLNRGKVNVVDQGQPTVAKINEKPATQPEKSSEQAAQVVPAVQPVIKKVEPKKIIQTVARVEVGRKDQPEIAKVQQPVVQEPTPEVVKPKEQEMIAQVPTKIEIKEPTVPDTNVPLTIKVLDAGTNLAPAKLAAITQTSATESARQPKRRGIHSFGDLVNIVASKVDKRHGNRMVDDDDNDSAIAMVNRGIQKISADREQEK